MRRPCAKLVLGCLFLMTVVCSADKGSLLGLFHSRGSSLFPARGGEKKSSASAAETSPVERTDPHQAIRISNNDVKIALINCLNGLGGCIFLAVMFRSMIRSLGESVDYIASKMAGGSNNATMGLSPISRFLGNATLNSYESELAGTIVDPATIDVDLKDIGGLKDVKRSLLDCSSSLVEEEPGVVVGSNALLKSVGGILLFGPPGCGKSVLVRALAKKRNLPLLPLQPSSLLRKFVGESSQLTRAVFTLAAKLSPCIIFLDEMDSLFRSRQDEENSVDRSLKTEFMQLWDQLGRSNPGVLVVGATNRPQDVDAAIQRRFERSFLIGPPNEHARADIFRLVLKNTQLDAAFDFGRCAASTEGYTPSDITNVCKAAVHIPLREFKRLSTRHRQVESSTPSSSSSALPSLRPLRWTDIQEALTTVYPTQWTASTYGALSKSQTNQAVSNVNEHHEDQDEGEDESDVE